MFARRTNWKLEENEYTRALHRLRRSGEQILDLAASNPTTCGFLYDAEAILEALRDPAALVYAPDPRGLLSAREAVADYYREKAPGAHFDPRNLILTTGTSEAYSFLFRLLCEPGDEVVAAHPSYPLFDFLADIQDVKLRPFRLLYDHGWQMDFQALREAIGARTRAILLVHPNNPTGHFIRAGEAAQLNDICRERGLALVVDEVFSDYALSPPAGRDLPHGSFAFNSSVLTFVLSGLSKVSALPQCKLAWIAAGGPDSLVRDALARLEIIADTFLSLNASVQHALSTLLGLRASMQAQIRRRIQSNLERLDARLATQKCASRLEMEGGWYAVLRVPALQPDEALAIRLLERHLVSVHPGHFYNFSGDGFLVLSLLTPSEEFEEGIARLLECLASP